MQPISNQQILSQLQSIAQQAGIPQASTSATTSVAPSSEFSQLLKQSIKSVNRYQQRAGDLAKAFETNDPNINLAQVMMEKQKAKIAFEALLQVRNQLVNSYQEIMRMPI